MTRAEFESDVDYDRLKRDIVETLADADEAMTAKAIANYGYVSCHRNNVYQPLNELADAGYITKHETNGAHSGDEWELTVTIVDEIEVEKEPKWLTVDEALLDLSEFVYLNVLLFVGGITWLAIGGATNIEMFMDVAFGVAGLGAFGGAMLALVIHQEVPGGVIEWMHG